MLIKAIQRSRLSLSQGWLGGILCDLARSATLWMGREKRDGTKKDRRQNGLRSVRNRRAGTLVGRLELT